MLIKGGSLSDAILKLNNRYQEMSGIMINESLISLVNPPLRGGWKTNNREQSKKTTSYN
jgi:hypothetical protein